VLILASHDRYELEKKLNPVKKKFTFGGQEVVIETGKQKLQYSLPLLAAKTQNLVRTFSL
jgi:hypothetical protein